MRASRACLLVILAAALVGACRARPGRPADGAPASAPAGQEPQCRATAKSMIEAPVGATPCESAYNALLVFIGEADAEARELGKPSRFATVPTRETFLAACTTLPEAQQHCLIPRSSAGGNRACRAALAQLKREGRYRGVLFPERRREGAAAASQQQSQ